jgi:anti-sigma B factor antagonist
MKVALEQMDEPVGVVVVIPEGKYLDASHAQNFKRNMKDILENHTQIVCDMSQLEFVDSAGLGALVSCLRQLKATGGDLKLCHLAKPVRALFELVRMHRIFDIFHTREEAALAF